MTVGDVDHGDPRLATRMGFAEVWSDCGQGGLTALTLHVRRSTRVKSVGVPVVGADVRGTLSGADAARCCPGPR